MEKIYFNVMEQLVEDEYILHKDSFNCCQCEHCKNDIVALTLNHLPPKYVVSTRGALMVKLSNMRVQDQIDVVKELAISVKIVSSFPRH